MVFQIFLKPFQIFLKNVEIHGRTDELYADRVLRTTCATSCTPVASSRQLAPRVVRRSRPPDNLRRELYAGRVLSFMAGLCHRSGAHGVRVSSRDLRELPESILRLGIEARFRGIVGHAAVHPNGVNEYIALCNLLNKTAESDSARSAKWRRLPSRC